MRTIPFWATNRSLSMENREIHQTVLVVEDEIFIRMSTVASLEDAGLRVLEAANSAEALRILGQHPEISVLVTDVRMSGVMDGLALVSRVQREKPVIRSIVVSGNATASEADRVAISVIGRYFMNCPTTPGQNRRGEKAAMRVKVAAITGPDMRLAASE